MRLVENVIASFQRWDSCFEPTISSASLVQGYQNLKTRREDFPSPWFSLASNKLKGPKNFANSKD